jgi:Flp pilus assembly protein TadD
LPFTNWRTKVISRADIDKRYNNELVKLNKVKIKYTSNRYFSRITSNPNDGDAFLQLGMIYGDAGELVDARKYLEKAQNLMPGNSEVIRQLKRLKN